MVWGVDGEMGLHLGIPSWMEFVGVLDPLDYGRLGLGGVACV